LHQALSQKDQRLIFWTRKQNEFPAQFKTTHEERCPENHDYPDYLPGFENILKW
jgi:hypothetical protein